MCISMLRLSDVCPNTVVMLADLPDADTLDILRSLGLLSPRPFRICAVNPCCVIVQCDNTRIGIARRVADIITVRVLE
jgi:Fe2+ transport system protein FeoA